MEGCRFADRSRGLTLGVFGTGAGAFGEVVLAQGLGHEDRQAARDEEGNRDDGAPAGGDHAPHLG